MILAGDVGGTKCNLAWFEQRGGELAPQRPKRFPSSDFSSFEDIVRTFLKEEPGKVDAACFGVAGPIVAGNCNATNLPWVITAAGVAKAAGASAVSLINDLEATAYGIQTLPPEAFVTLNEGEPQPHGAIAVIAAGTGLGEAGMVWDGRRYRAVPTEGGHTDFAPRDDLEIELLRYLARRHGHVSYERLLSGPGKLAIYEFLRDTGRGEEPPWLRERFAAGDPSAIVSEVGLAGEVMLCAKTVDLFCSLYGAEAGNLALKYLATGGVFVGGGIAPTLLPKLTDGTFMKGFLDKGRLRPVLSKIPVKVILDDRTALFGAAWNAAEAVSTTSTAAKRSAKASRASKKE